MTCGGVNIAYVSGNLPPSLSPLALPSRSPLSLSPLAPHSPLSLLTLPIFNVFYFRRKYSHNGATHNSVVSKLQNNRREREKEGKREKERERGKERGKERERERERGKERERERERERESEREGEIKKTSL
jgi:hypothetical protein